MAKLLSFAVLAVAACAHASPELKLIADPQMKQLALSQFCSEVENLYRRQKWGKTSCSSMPFEITGFSVEGRPIVSFEVGEKTSSKLTVIQCGIHGDELPALPMCLNLIQEITDKKRNIPQGTRLIVQPLLNPDGMFKAKATRPNSRGVDINRNFPTKDFAESKESWKKRDKGDPRKFPGATASSEPETRAILDFIVREKPQKIISIHTPLGFLDLDSSGGEEKRRRAQYLAINMSKNSGNYAYKRFGFYPGSLGNWAGQERQIPVYTLELPSNGVSAPTVDAYWTRFRKALWRAIDFDLDTGQFFED